MGPRQYSPLTHFGYTQGALYARIQSLPAMLQCIAQRGQGPRGALIAPELIDEMKKVHSQYGPASPTLSYGLGLLMIHDPRLSRETILGHQGTAYGNVCGAFMTEQSQAQMIFLSGGCSEARDGMLLTANRDMLRWGFEEVASWK